METHPSGENAASAIDLPPRVPGEAGPYTLIGGVKAKPGLADALETRLLALVALARAAGAVQYHLHRDRADDHTFVFYEAWRSLEHLRAYLAEPLVQAFFAERMNFLAEDINIQWVAMRSSYPEAEA